MANEVSLGDDIVSEYQGIETLMADPEVASDQNQFRKLEALCRIASDHRRAYAAVAGARRSFRCQRDGV